MGTPAEREHTEDTRLDLGALFPAKGGGGLIIDTTKPLPIKKGAVMFGDVEAAARAETNRKRSVEVALHAKLEEEHPCKRFQPQDWPQWGEWMTTRLYDRFPKIPIHSWLGRLIPFMSDNSAFFVRNEYSVLLVNSILMPPDGHELLLEAFALSRHAVQKDGAWGIPHMEYDKEQTLTTLYRHAKEWGRRRKSLQLYIGRRSDILPNRLREIMDGKHCKWIGFSL